MPNNKEINRNKKIETYKIDYLGKTYGFLTITDITGYNEKGQVIALVICVCGIEKRLGLYRIHSGIVTSCGCRNTNRIESNFHGLSHDPLYTIWEGIKNRCCNDKSKYFYLYGGRGITVCDEWKNNFKKFYDWCMSNGYEKGLQIDRYPDKNGGYYPNNCRWVTPKENMNNTNANVILDILGESLTVTEAAEKYNMSPLTLRSRLLRGWSVFKSINTPINCQYRKNKLAT